MIGFRNVTPLARNVLKLAVGTGLGQVVALATAPIIARLYGPEAFGEQSALISIVALVGIISSFSFPIAIVVAKSDKEASALATLTFIGSTILSLVIYIVLRANNFWLLQQLGISVLAGYLFMIPPLTIFINLNASAIYLLSRHGAFSRSAVASVLSVITASLSKIAFGMTFPGTLALLVGNSTGYLTAPLASLRYSYFLQQRHFPFTLEYLRNTFWKYREFPVLRSPRDFMVALTQSLPILGLTTAYGAEISGQYTLAFALLSAPVSLLGSSLQTVFYPHVSEMVREERNIFRLMRRAFLVALILGAFPFLAVTFWGQEIFQVLLGDEWREAGVFGAILVPFVWSGLAIKPLVASIPPLGLQKGFLIFEIFSTGGKVSIILWGVMQVENPFVLVGAYSLFGTLGNGWLAFWVLAASRSREKRMGMKENQFK